VLLGKVGTPLVVHSNDGAVLASGPPGRNDSRLLRCRRAESSAGCVVRDLWHPLSVCHLGPPQLHRAGIVRL